MSEMVHYKGRAVKLEMKGMSQIKWLRIYAKQNNINIKYNIEDYDLYDLLDTCGLWDTIIPVNSDFYKIIDNNDIHDENIFKANKNEDKSINFELKYYNGGCSFTEALETAVNKMKEE